MAKRTGLEGISADGNGIVQTKRGGGYMILVRGAGEYGGWGSVAETRYYVDACIALDQIDAQRAS